MNFRSIWRLNFENSVQPSKWFLPKSPTGVSEPQTAQNNFSKAHAEPPEGSLQPSLQTGSQCFNSLIDSSGREWRHHVAYAGFMSPVQPQRSKVWSHFTKKDGNRATCKVDISSQGGNTTSMQKLLMNVAFSIRSGLTLVNLIPAATLAWPRLIGKFICISATTAGD